MLQKGWGNAARHNDSIEVNARGSICGLIIL